MILAVFLIRIYGITAQEFNFTIYWALHPPIQAF